MLRDLRHALRFFAHHKAFTATAVLTLAIGLGANTALYGLLNATFRPLDLPDANRLVTIVGEPRGDETGGFQFAFSTEQMKDLQDRTEVFSDVVGFVARVGGFVDNGKASTFWFAAVSHNYFGGLKVRPAAGALLETNSGSPVRIVLGHGFWKKHFAGDPGVVGRIVRLDGEPAVISGVVEPSFGGTMVGVELDGYIDIEDYGIIEPGARRWLYHNRRARTLTLLGRLKPGVSLNEAQASTDRLLAALAAEHPDSDRGFGAAVIPETLARPLPMRSIREAVPLVRAFTLAVAALVLLLACMNVANLLLVRATGRQREMAVRAALGASRGRLIRQMVTEGLVLSIFGGAAGFVLGRWVTGAYLARLDLGGDIPLRFNTSFDVRVFAFSLVAALLTGLAIGMWPAWRASRADARGALHEGGRSQSDGVDRQRVRRVLVVGQIAGALALLVVAGLFIRTLASAQQIDLGFDAHKLISMRVDPKYVNYNEEQTNDFFDRLLERIDAWPDVQAASVCLAPPMSYIIGGGSIHVEGRPVDPDGQPPASFINHVGHDYFDVMGIPIVKGRAFTEDDEHQHSTNRRYAIVNETFAEQYWPGQEAVGKRFRAYNTTEALLEVVGVARDSKYVIVFESRRPYVYLPMVRDQTMRTVMVRATGDPASLAPRLEREVASLDPGMPIADLRTMDQTLVGIFGFLLFRVGAIQAGGAGVLGLVLAIVGVYGVVSFGASLRTREIGIRVALGALPRDVMRLIVGQGLAMVSAGIAGGLIVSALMSRVLSKFLPLVNAGDWRTFAYIAGGLAVMALAACYIPARRATKVPVTTALRHE
ncbi:MAG TPA: ABC transporter permease [Vicinamibacterales bacterium]|nr:ABC transporter permease [Vicinamibacterales bacterium]